MTKRLSTAAVTKWLNSPELRASERWFVSVHEAAHSVAHFVLAKPEGRERVMCVVVDQKRRTIQDRATGGLAYASGLSGLEDAVMIAAGKAATDLLLPKIRPPAAAAPRPGILSKTVSKKSAISLKRDCDAPGPSDAERLARWTIEGHETCPELWAGRYGNAIYSAELLVKQNESAVVAVADLLFTTGICLPSNLKKILHDPPRLMPWRVLTPPADAGTTPEKPGNEGVSK
jgi:hypothetical protein